MKISIERANHIKSFIYQEKSVIKANQEQIIDIKKDSIKSIQDCKRRIAQARLNLKMIRQSK